jgi:hypothetical protein
VTDGDTFRIGETVVRLADIDAPELAQTCDGPAKLRSCGAYVADALAERVEGYEVRCTVLAIDQYDRRIARCDRRWGSWSRRSECWRPPEMRWRRIAGSVAETHLHDTLAPVAEAVIQKVCAPMPAVNDDPLFVPSGDRLGGFAIRRL